VLFRPDRTRRAGPWLEWKVRIFVTGAVLGLAGIFLDERGLVVAALVVLALGVGIGLLPGGRGRPRDEPEGDRDDVAGSEPDDTTEAGPSAMGDENPGR
jgi:hypothetical protein